MSQDTQIGASNVESGQSTDNSNVTGDPGTLSLNAAVTTAQEFNANVANFIGAMNELFKTQATVAQHSSSIVTLNNRLTYIARAVDLLSERVGDRRNSGYNPSGPVAD